MNLELNGRKVVDTYIDGIDTKDAPDFCDAYIAEGVFEDTGMELTATELEELQDLYADKINEMVYDQLY